MLLRLLIALLLPVWFSPADDPGLMEHRPGIQRGMTREQVEKMLGITEPVFGMCNGYFNSGFTAYYPRGITDYISVSYDGAGRVEKVEFGKYRVEKAKLGK
jgi:hypothetical protein